MIQINAELKKNLSYSKWTSHPSKANEVFQWNSPTSSHYWEHRIAEEHSLCSCPGLAGWMCEKSWAFPAVRRGVNHPKYSVHSLEFLCSSKVQCVRWEGPTATQLEIYLFYSIGHQLCLTMPLPAWKGFLHIQCHHRKSSPEGNFILNLSERGLKLSGVGPGVNSCAASDTGVPSGLHTRLWAGMDPTSTHRKNQNISSANFPTAAAWGAEQHNPRGCQNL